MIKILIGGSPCTHWSIAQSKNRETTAEGEGWELFKNYLLARERFAPDFFLYENNKSVAPAIKEQISAELNAPLQYINSALVSAQNRERFYVHNFGDVPQPDDRGILLQGVLQGDAIAHKEKAYTLRASGGHKQGISNLIRHIETSGQYGYMGVCEPLAAPVMFSRPHGFNKGGVKYEKAPTLTANGAYVDNNHVIEAVRVAASVRVGSLPNGRGEIVNSQGKRIYSIEGKSVPLQACASAGGTSDQSGNRTGLYAVPVRIGTIENSAHGQEGYDSKPYRVYAPYGKSVTLQGEAGGAGAKTGLYACPVDMDAQELDTEYFKGAFSGNLIGQIVNNGKHKNGQQPSQQYRVYATTDKSICLDQDSRKYYACPTTPSKGTRPIYRVEAGQIEIKGKLYPIRLPDGFYIIRKLSVTECCRLQTLPDDYCRAVSPSQAYRGLGNGWTAEVIIHLLSHGLRDVPKDERIVVLSMYDGIGTGRYCFDRMGYKNITYYAYEFDDNAVRIAMSNYPDIKQCGDAFSVRKSGWFLASGNRRTAL